MSIALLSVLFICISSINAADVNDNSTSNYFGNLETDNNDLSNCNISAGLLKNNNEVNLDNSQNISNNENYLNNPDISNLVHINQTSDNTFILNLDNKTTTAYRFMFMYGQFFHLLFSR